MKKFTYKDSFLKELIWSHVDHFKKKKKSFEVNISDNSDFEAENLSGILHRSYSKGKINYFCKKCNYFKNNENS